MLFTEKKTDDGKDWTQKPNLSLFSMKKGKRKCIIKEIKSIFGMPMES